MIDVTIGNWPAYIDVFALSGGVGAPYVSIEADHNTGKYDTALDRNQVIELHKALGQWLEETA